MKRFVPLALLASAALTGCTASTFSFGSDDSLFIGTRSADGSGNGLPFAVPASVLADLEDEGAIRVKVVRALTDWDSGTTQLVVSNETLTLSSGDTSDLGNIVLTLGGETLVFASGFAPASSGQDDWEAYLNSSGEVSGTGAVYTYERAQNPALSGEFDSEAFFTFGFETDPDEIAALVSTALYSGEFNGFGQVLDPVSGGVVGTEEEFSGIITLFADFDNPSVDGTLSGTFDYDGTGFVATFDAPIEGNGYNAPVETMTCAGATCESSSEIGGAFFGTDALETSGIIGMDVTVEPDLGDTYRFISGGGFTATQ